MNIPEWLKPALYGAVVGGVIVSIGGFSWGGWMTGSSADRMAQEMAQNEVVAALVPVCVDLSRKDINRAQKLEKLQGLASYKQREALMETGWATMPGADSPNRELAKACVEALEATAS
ncbi:hypothetical protein HH303_18365 [Rhodospirillaceae bacterium KN72]|uniref:Uncharacterized protein n=1 Tax=Pacificispira spongiicola TaxID=2729598 RepID=A0A7Y0HG31_9PROT|nr:hypothetical protein [Pacificispira spongiicola]NMM46461.1 hypothetical protein [Pacificispira spongiicola]